MLTLIVAKTDLEGKLDKETPRPPKPKPKPKSTPKPVKTKKAVGKKRYVASEESDEDSLQ